MKKNFKILKDKFESYKDFILYLRTLPFFNEKMTRNDKLGDLNEDELKQFVDIVTIIKKDDKDNK